MSLSLLDRSDQTGPSDHRADRVQPTGHGPGSTPETLSSAGQPAAVSSSGSRVLLVDDSNSIRTEIRLLLEEAGLTVVGEGMHGAEGVMLARELRPDVVVMDVRMPILDGIAATGYITRELPGVRVIVFSAFDDQELTQAARAAGASCVLTKGASPAAIADAVQDAIG
jgi:DNA-binding NarL/FixJ family response regulator